MLPQGLGPDAKPSRESPCSDHTQARVSKSLMRGGVFLQLVALFLGWAPWLCLCPMVHGGWPDSAHGAAWPLLAAPSPALGVLAVWGAPRGCAEASKCGWSPLPVGNSPLLHDLGLPQGRSLSCWAQPVPWQQAGEELAFFCLQNRVSTEDAWGPRCWLDLQAALGRRSVKDIFGVWPLSFSAHSCATGKKAVPAPLLVCKALGPGVALLPVEGYSLSSTSQVASQSWAVWRVGCLIRAGTALTLRLLTLSVSIRAAWVAEPSLQFGADSFQRQRPPRGPQCSGEERAGDSAHACHAVQSGSCCLLLAADHGGQVWP